MPAPVTATSTTPCTGTDAAQREERLRQEIMLCVQANNLPVTGEFWLCLIFRTESQLKDIARELHIQVDPL